MSSVNAASMRNALSGRKTAAASPANLIPQAEIRSMLTQRSSRTAPALNQEEGLAFRALEEGFGRLRFPQPLEREFRTHHLAASHRWVRMSILVALATTTGFAIIDHHVIHAVNALPDVVRFGLQFPVVLICLLATSKRFYMRAYEAAIQIGAPLFGIGTVVMASCAQPEHMALVGARVLLVAFFLYFMLGLRLVQALRVNLFVLAAMLLTGVIGLMPTGVATYLTFALVCANIIGSAGAYALEHANRTAFLERKLLVEMAAHDGLTRLLNRQTFESRVLQTWQEAAGTRTLTVLMIDVDDFKQYNDQYGHQAGDECLQRIAGSLRNSLGARPGDLLARYGGEEFIAVLPDRSVDEAQSIAKRILQDIAALNIAHAASPVGGFVSVSVGPATLQPPQTHSYQAVAKLADNALYLAKRNGRNCTVAVQVELSSVPEQRPDMKKTARSADHVPINLMERILRLSAR